MRTSDIIITAIIILAVVGLVFTFILLVISIDETTNPNEELCKDICERKGHDYVGRGWIKSDPCKCLTKYGEIVWFRDN